MSPLYSHEHIDWNKDWWGTQRLRILCSWGRCFPGCPWRERAKSSPSAKSQHLFQVRFPSDPSPEGQTSLQMSFSLAVIISFLNILYTVIHIPCVQSTAHQQSLQSSWKKCLLRPCQLLLSFNHQSYFSFSPSPRAVGSFEKLSCCHLLPPPLWTLHTCSNYALFFSLHLNCSPLHPPLLLSTQHPGV